MSFAGFPVDTLKFLSDLQANNNREWFQANRARYENSFLQPALEFIEAVKKPLGKVAPMLLAEPKKMGGSLMRIYKDTRFSADKTPYKTNIGIHFRHQMGKDVHAPGMYFHIDPTECFIGAGIWMPPQRCFAKNSQLHRRTSQSLDQSYHQQEFCNHLQFVR